MFSSLLSVAVSIQDGLHFVPDVFGHDGLVFALVVDASESDDPLVEHDEGSVA